MFVFFYIIKHYCYLAFEFASMLSRLDKEQEVMKLSIETGTQALDTVSLIFLGFK